MKNEQYDTAPRRSNLDGGCHGLGHRLGQSVIAPGLQGTDGAFAVWHLMVLVQLALALQAGDADFEAHDVAQLLGQVIGRRIPHLPGAGLVGLVLARELGHHAPDKAFVVVNMHGAMGMDHFVVPGGHAPMRLVLAGVPIGRDVALGTAKHHQNGVAIGHLLPKGVGPRNVGDECALRALIGLQQQRQVMGLQPVGGVRHQHAQGVVADDAVKFFDARLGKLSRQVHVTTLIGTDTGKARRALPLCGIIGLKEISSFLENDQASSTMPLMPKGRPSRSRALYEEIRARIADGTFAPGLALPSTRALAAERGLSRATVTLVYEQLAADGFIETRIGASSRVAPGGAAGAAADPSAGQPPLHGRSAPAGQNTGRLSAIGHRMAAFGLHDARPTAAGEIDFIYGPLSGADFPTLAWSKAMRHVERQRVSRLAYEDPRGNLPLRQALHAHLSQTRGLVCTLDQIMIVNGSQQALDLCARLLLDPGDGVIVENPGYQAAHQAFMAYGARLACIDVDAQGMKTEQLEGLGPAQMAYVTPTHQFPMGSFLPLARRRQLLAWAHETGAWVIEDDYDSEYRYTVGPEETLQSLDRHAHVIHVGTFSKTLSPQLRLGYMVLPPGLVDTFATAKRLTDRQTASGVQRALALLLEDGSYARHVRRIRRHQAARQHALTEALTHHLGDRIEIQGAASGLHVVVWCRSLPSSAETALVQAARDLGVRVYPISPLYHPHPTGPGQQRPAGLIMGYALLGEAAIVEGVQRLGAALQQVQAGTRPSQGSQPSQPTAG